MKHTDPTKRHDFVLFFDVENGNPNGDPDAGNLPRVDPETMHGLVTDVAIKRKVRDFVEMTQNIPVFIQSETALNRLISDAAIEVGVKHPQIDLKKLDLKDDTVEEWFVETQPENFDFDPESKMLSYTGDSFKEKNIKSEFKNVEDKALKNSLDALAKPLAKSVEKEVLNREDRKNTQRRMIEKYYDIRMFGAVLSTGLNAGQVRGPLQFTFAKSVGPIHRLDLSITRKAITKEADRKEKETEMARKPIVPYGLYRAHGFYNPYFAEKTNVSPEDLELLWRALTNMFELDRAAARGHMSTRGIYVFTHECKDGNASAHKLFDLIKNPVPKQTEIDGEYLPPRAFEDYKPIEINREKLPEGVSLWTSED